MSGHGARPPSAPPPPPTAALPPLVLRARLSWRILFSVAAAYGLLGGTDNLARGLSRHGVDPLYGWVLPILQILCGAWLAWGAVRYAFSRLVLDDRGFALRGPLGTSFIAWQAVIDWRRRPRRGGLAPQIWVVHGDDRRLLWLPLIYEDSHVLEVALEQRAFPRF